MNPSVSTNPKRDAMKPPDRRTNPRLRTYRTSALILKRRNFNEADRLLTILTPDRGKLEVIAKGARKPSSRKTGHIELYSRADVLLARGRTFHVLTQAELQEPYLPIREDLLRSAYAGYASELVDRFTFEADDTLTRPVFDLLDATLARFCTSCEPMLAVRYFELHLLHAVGFRPELSECVVTREALQPIDQFFSFEEGGVVSPAGTPRMGSLVQLSLPALKLLRHLQRSPFSQVQTLQIDLPYLEETEFIMHGYIRHILETRLQSVGFLQQVRALRRRDF